MSRYRAPLQDMHFVLQSLQGLERLAPFDRFAALSQDVVTDVLAEAARFAEQVLAPLYHSADRQGIAFSEGRVSVPDDLKSAYRQFVEAGWPSLACPLEFGGQGLPELLATPVAEMWRSANLAFALGPMLTQAAADALHRHGSDELKSLYLPKLVGGEWTGTMNLTEPQAGSDLSRVETEAIPDGNRYRIKGRKIFITWGDHDLSDNIVHLVLARTPGAPAGVKGLSLFVVPKRIVNPDGSLGELNDVATLSVEKKLGIHASPTCVLSYGDRGGAIAYLVGAQNEGLDCMFTMMNRARLAVGVEALGIAERAYQKALGYARERIQGRPPGGRTPAAIIRHPDVRRMLLTMKANLQAMRSVAYSCALNLDLAGCAEAPDVAERAEQRASLLTPIVKGWCSEMAQEVVSLGLQVHGGAGYIEETGAAQIVRDARITTIYEGTTGIQANDLVKRKLIGDGGQAARRLLGEIEASLADGAEALPRALRERLAEGARTAGDAIGFVLDRHAGDPAAAGAASVPLLLLLGTLIGGWQVARGAVRAAREIGAGATPERRRYLQSQSSLADFYGSHVLPRTQSYGSSVLAGSASVMSLDDDQF